MHTIKLHSTITQDDIQNSATLEEAAHTLSAEARGLGWDLVAFHKDIKANELPRNQVGDFVASSMGWSRECLTTWTASEMAAVCPISMRCSVTDTPFAWYPDPERGIWRDHALNGRSVEALELYGTCIAAAVTVPVRRRSGHGYVSWCTLDKSRLAGLCEEHYASMFLTSHLFMQQIDHIEVAHYRGLQCFLTAREEECLTWAARGKTAEEIGIILRRSRETARFHLRNAAAKLEATNRTHAVARACGMGLISV
jgi:DNA-binding CsgD family transcriptional regulator